jgi:lysophospholipase L1-like esterase
MMDMLCFCLVFMVQLLFLVASSTSETQIGTEAVADRRPPLFRVIFEGDMTTFGFGGEVFENDANLNLGQSFAYLAEAKLNRYNPHSNLQFINYGEVDTTLKVLMDRWHILYKNRRPCMVSLLVGIDDVVQARKKGGTFDASQYESTLTAALQEMRTDRPDIGAMLCTVAVFKTRSSIVEDQYDGFVKDVAALNAAINSTASKLRLPLVDFAKRFQQEFDRLVTQGATAQEVWDMWSINGINPSPAASQIMADEWIKVFLDQTLPRYRAETNHDEHDVNVDGFAARIHHVLAERLPTPYAFNASADAHILPFHLRTHHHTAADGIPASFLFEGDSITDGYHDSTRKYGDLFTIGHGFTYMLSGFIRSKVAKQAAQYGFVNAGESGAPVRYVNARWKDKMGLKPWITHLLVGINDPLLAHQEYILSFHKSTSEFMKTHLRPYPNPTAQFNATHWWVNYTAFEVTYDSMLALAREKNPNGHIIVGTPFAYFSEGMLMDNLKKDPHRDVHEGWRLFRSCVDEIDRIVQKLAYKHSYPLINYQALFDGVMAATNSHVLHWTVDGLHPASAGHHLMAEEILKTIDFLYAAEEVIPEVTQRSTT